VKTPGIVSRSLRGYGIAGCAQARSLRGYDVAGRAHSRRSRLIAASRTAALAKVRAAMSQQGEAVWMDHGRLAGHRTMITAGVSFASISSTVIVSVLVIWPVASSVILLTGLDSWLVGS
jgi:hypothetical protein